MPNTPDDQSKSPPPVTAAGNGLTSGPDLGPEALVYIEPEALVYIEKVRQATGRLSAREVVPEDIGQALQALRDVSAFDAEVPTGSPRREVQLVKTGVKRLSAWYMRYLSGQLNAFGTNIVALGDALVSRTERLEASTDEMAARLGAVEARLKRLEAGAAPAPAGAALAASAERLQHPSSGATGAPPSPGPKARGAGTSPASRRNSPRRGQRP
jgi:hypothetical protein